MVNVKWLRFHHRTKGILSWLIRRDTCEMKNLQLNLPDVRNEVIVRAYYLVKKKEVDGFRPKLHEEFIVTYSELRRLTNHRIADQYRVIIWNNKVPQPPRFRIRQKVERELNNTTLQVSRKCKRSTIAFSLSNANHSLSRRI